MTQCQAATSTRCGKQCRREAKAGSVFCGQHERKTSRNLFKAAATSLPSTSNKTERTQTTDLETLTQVFSATSRQDLDRFSSAFDSFIAMFQTFPGVGQALPYDAVQNLQNMDQKDPAIMQEAFWTILKANEKFRAHLDKFDGNQYLQLQHRYNHLVQTLMSCALRDVLSNTARIVRTVRSGKNFGPKNLLACAREFEKGIDELIASARSSTWTVLSGVSTLGFFLLMATTTLWQIWVVNVLLFAVLHDFGIRSNAKIHEYIMIFVAQLAGAMMRWFNVSPQVTVAAVTMGAYEVSAKDPVDAFHVATGSRGIEIEDIVASHKLREFKISTVMFKTIFTETQGLGTSILHKLNRVFGPQNRFDETIGQRALFIFIVASLLNSPLRRPAAAFVHRIGGAVWRLAYAKKNPAGYPTNLRFIQN